MIFNKKLVACEVGPNYELKDAFISIFSLLNIFNWFAKDTKKKNIDFLKKYFNLKNEQQIYLTDSGRTGLLLLLKSLKKTLGLNKSDEVMIQGFSCIVLPNSIWQAGLKPALIDTKLPNFLDAEKSPEIGYNPDLEDIKNRLNKNTKILILQYTFGIVPKDLDQILDFCKKNKIVVIEDIAHSLGADFENKKIGTLADATFFSFGRDKIISTTTGGGMFINPSKNSFLDQKTLDTWNNNLALEYKKLSKMKSSRVLQSLLYPILATFLIRPFYHLIFGKIVLFISRKLKLIGEVYTNKEKEGTTEIETASKYPDRFAFLLSNQLKKIDKYNQHRKKIAKIYATELALEFSKNSVYMRFPISFKDNKKFNLIKQKLRKKGILVGTWYNSLFLPEIDYKSKFDYQEKDLKNVEFLSQNRTLNLATNIYVTPKIALQQTHLIKECFHKDSV